MSERLSPSEQYVDRWGVMGDSGKEYVVARRADGSWTCSCPHAVFRKATCKHQIRVQQELQEAGGQLDQLQRHRDRQHAPIPVQPARQQPRTPPPAFKPVPVPPMAPEMARMKVRRFRDDE